MPAAEPNGFIKTLNNMGYMTSTLDSYSEAFTDFASKQSGWSLDVGAAYGIATKSAITKGAQIVANDICAEHLDIIEADIGDKFGNSFRKAPGDFLNQKINPDSLAAILACRVLHFYTGEKIEAAASLFYSWLNRNGRVFIVCETPYLSNFQTFIPTFEERKRAGIKWPGFINDVQAIAPERGAFLPKEIHLLDPDTLRRTFEEAGFKTILCDTIKRSDFPIDLQFDGRESVGYIGEKV